MCARASEEKLCTGSTRMPASDEADKTRRARFCTGCYRGCCCPGVIIPCSPIDYKRFLTSYIVSSDVCGEEENWKICMGRGAFPQLPSPRWSLWCWCVDGFCVVPKLCMDGYSSQSQCFSAHHPPPFPPHALLRHRDRSSCL